MSLAIKGDNAIPDEHLEGMWGHEPGNREGVKIVEGENPWKR